MKKLTAALLAGLLLLGAAACDGSGTQGNGTTRAAYSTPAAQIRDEDGQLAAFFNGDAESALTRLSPVLFAFSQALYAYPEVLKNLPDDNFGWAYLYHLIAVYGQDAKGIQRRAADITATRAALDELQVQTLGGALWSTPGADFAELVQYDGKKDLYTLKNGQNAPACGAYFEDVVYRKDAAAADVTVVLFDAAAGQVPGEGEAARYVLTLRAAPDSAFVYHISGFAAG